MINNMQPTPFYNNTERKKMTVIICQKMTNEKYNYQVLLGQQLMFSI